MPRNLIHALLFISAALIAQPARAALVFEFGQSSYQVVPNGTVDVDVFLTATGTDRNYLLSTSIGRIFALGVQVNNNQVGTGARVATSADILANTATFDDLLVPPQTSVGLGFAKVAAFTNDLDGVALPDANPLRVRLATFRYTSGTTAGVVTTLSFADYDATTNIAASDGAGGTIALDGLVNFSNTATITAVPEPSSLLLVAGGIAFAGMRRRNRTLGEPAN